MIFFWKLNQSDLQPGNLFAFTYKDLTWYIFEKDYNSADAAARRFFGHTAKYSFLGVLEIGEGVIVQSDYSR